MARHWLKRFPRRLEQTLDIEPDLYEYEDPAEQNPLGAAKGCLWAIVLWGAVAVVAIIVYSK